MTLDFLKEAIAPKFAQPLSVSENPLQNKIPLYDIFILTADDYHFKTDYDEVIKDILTIPFFSTELKVYEGNKNDYYQFIYSKNELTENQYAQLIIEFNNIKSNKEFDNFVNNTYWDQYFWNRVIKVSPKTQKKTFKTDTEFLDKNKNPVWQPILSQLK